MGHSNNAHGQYGCCCAARHRADTQVRQNVAPEQVPHSLPHFARSISMGVTLTSPHSHFIFRHLHSGTGRCCKFCASGSTAGTSFANSVPRCGAFTAAIPACLECDSFTPFSICVHTAAISSTLAAWRAAAHPPLLKHLGVTARACGTLPAYALYRHDGSPRATRAYQGGTIRVICWRPARGRSPHHCGSLSMRRCTIFRCCTAWLFISVHTL